MDERIRRCAKHLTPILSHFNDSGLSLHNRNFTEQASKTILTPPHLQNVATVIRPEGLKYWAAYTP